MRGKFLGAALLILLLAGCANLDKNKDESSNEMLRDYMFVVTTDYASGAYSSVELNTWEKDINIGTIHSDAVVRLFNGEIYVVNRLGQDNLLVLDAKDLKFKRQFSVGPGTNPQDVAFLSSSKAFVSRYQTNELLIINPSTGTSLGTIDLSAYQDADGLCEMGKMVLHNGKLYVTVQRMFQWAPVGDSYLVVINATTNAIEKAILLTGTNPYDLVFAPDLNRILVAEVGNWMVQDAGVEAIDPDTDTALGYLVTETDLGGDCSILEVYSATKVFGIVSPDFGTTTLVSFNPSTQAMLNGNIYTPTGFSLADLELDDYDRLYVADRTSTNPGVRIFDAITESQLSTTPIDVGLPPYNILFVNR